jgi:uncharacterized ion transporter superfamily protein YfcC
MYSYDLLLYAIMVTVIVFLVYQFIKNIKKDPDFWLVARTNREYIKHWDHLEKMQPKSNKPILNLERKKPSSENNS